MCGFSRGGIIPAGFLNPFVSCLWCVLCVTNKQLSTSWQRKLNIRKKLLFCVHVVDTQLDLVLLYSCASERGS